MKKILIKDIGDGDVLARDARDPDGKLLFSKGTIVGKDHIESLRRRRIKIVYVEGRELPEILQNFDSQALKAFESEIENRFKLTSENEVMQETLRIAKKILIARALQKGEILTESQLNLVARLNDLPPPPPIYPKLIQMINDPRTTSKTFGSALSAEPAIANKILDLANSPFYHFSQKFKTIENAVSMLGMPATAELVLIFATIAQLSAEQNPLRYILRSIWGHCIGTGIIARNIARKIDLKNLEDIFSAAVFHDIGRLVIAAYCHDDYFKVEKMKNQAETEYIELEEEVLGYTHVDAGRMFCERWQLSNFIKNAVQYHHAFYETREYKMETALVHIANVFGHSLHYGKVKELVPDIDDEAWETSGLKIDDLESIMQESEHIFTETEHIFLSDSAPPNSQSLTLTVSRK